jgi:diguanylate cyclase (GGDEF)-like protein
VSRSARHGRIFSLVFVDIDHFKSYNDNYGHLAGDELLRHLARIFETHSRRSTITARYGGEEFVLLIPETDGEGAAALAEKLRRIVEDHPFRVSETQPVGRITLSMGVATYPADGEEATTLIDHADKALYHSKHQGRNTVSIWTPTLV